MATIYERINAALVTLGKRKAPVQSSDEEHGPGGSSVDQGPRKKEHIVTFRPFSQKELLRRLQTYKPLNWFARPEVASAVECAIRGWVNTSRDCLQCEFCSAQLRYPQQLLPEHRQAAAKAFAQQLSSAHAHHCPWRSTQSMRSLLLFQPPATSEEQEQLLQQFDQRQQRLQQVELLPDIDAGVITQLASADPAAFWKTVLPGRSSETSPPAPAPAATAAPSAPADPSSPTSPSALAPTSPSAAPCSTSLQPQASEEAQRIAQLKFTNAERARMLALLGWEMELIAGEGSGRASSTLSRLDCGQYSLLHLTGTSKHHKLSQAHLAQQRQQQQQGQPKVSVGNVLLTCPHCKARVGLWNFSGPRPAPIGRVTGGPEAAGKGPGSTAQLEGLPVTPRQGTTLGSQPSLGAADEAPIAAALSRTIAGGSYASSGAAAMAAGPFGTGASAPFGRAQAGAAPIFGRPGKTQSQGPTGAGAPAQLASPQPTPAANGTAAGGAAGRKRRAGDEGGPANGVVAGAGPSGEAEGAQGTSSKRPCLDGSAAADSGAAGTSSTPAAAPALLPLQLALGRLVPWMSPAAAGTPGASRAAHQANPLSTPAGAGLAAAPTSSSFDAIGHHRPWCPSVYSEVHAAVVAAATSTPLSSPRAVTPRAGQGMQSPSSPLPSPAKPGQAPPAAGAPSGEPSAHLSGWAHLLRIAANPTAPPTASAGFLNAAALTPQAGTQRPSGEGALEGGPGTTPGPAPGVGVMGEAARADGAGPTPSRGMYSMQAMVQGIKDVLRRRG